MHQLIELDRIEELLRTAESFPGGNGLVVNVGGFTRSILKFSSLSVGEVFGYEMAKPLGVRVARMQRFGLQGRNAPRCTSRGSTRRLAPTRSCSNSLLAAKT